MCENLKEFSFDNLVQRLQLIANPSLFMQISTSAKVDYLPFAAFLGPDRICPFKLPVIKQILQPDPSCIQFKRIERLEVYRFMQNKIVSMIDVLVKVNHI